LLCPGEIIMRIQTKRFYEINSKGNLGAKFEKKRKFQNNNEGPKFRELQITALSG
jgi:hypothetical protein